MRYMGGKHRQGKKIAEYVMRAWKPGMDYYEPFCGAMGVAHRVIDAAIGRGVDIPRIHLSDINQSLITMWQHALEGWIPPSVVDEETYNLVKSIRDPYDPMTAYCGFGISFGGKWFGGYARGSDYFARNAPRSVLLKASTLLKAPVLLKACEYDEIRPVNSVVYLDPPYCGRTKAYGVNFDHVPFWEYAANLVQSGNVVLVTEFIAPPEWVSVHSFGDTVVRHQNSKGADGTDERIFAHESQLNLFDLCQV